MDTSQKTSPIDLQIIAHHDSVSPQPSIDRLSVTFADELDIRDECTAQFKMTENESFPQEPHGKINILASDEDDDYSTSVTAIMQRRASERRSKKRRTSRRGSSSFNTDISRRRSSVFTTDSGDTAITVEDNNAANQEQVCENIKLHKDVLANVKLQPWNMRKKLKLVQQAKAYIKQHEGTLQERFARSHSTKDMFTSCNIFFVKKLQRLKRGAVNFSKWFIPWELRIKEIESHFGSVVASYFVFLRWLVWVNIAIATLWTGFVAIPEMLTADMDIDRKSILPEDKYNSTNFLTLWDFEGAFKYSPMFYGWYTNATRTDKFWSFRYSLPLAYFFTGLVAYIFSFVAILRKMAENSRMSKLSEKEDECTFTWKLFTGWDYMIGNTETAQNRVAAIVMGFKEALVEEAEKNRDVQSWRMIFSRTVVNIAVLSLLSLSAFAVVTVVARSNSKEASTTTWRRNEITIVMSLISLFFPILFELLGYFEHYHPRKQLRLQLARIMVLNLLNFYSLIIALFGKISTMTYDLQSFKACSLSSSSIPTLSTIFNDMNSSETLTALQNSTIPISWMTSSDPSTFYASSNTQDVSTDSGQLQSTISTMFSTSCIGKQNQYNYEQQSHLRSFCWETMFGQELMKLTIMDLVMTLVSTLCIDFLRALFVRHMNNCWCWDLEKNFPKYGDFKVAENILHLVNNQGMVWMGMFFSPGVVLVNVLKLYILMYLRSWAVLACNVPHEVIFRASRSNNFYYALLLMMLFLCVLPVSFAIVWLEPSWHCGPFSGHHRIYHIFTKTLRSSLPPSTHRILDYIASPGIIIPLLMLLILIIYYLISLSNALREANNDLKLQLQRERIEERRKIFQIKTGSNTASGKWKKLLKEMPSNQKHICIDEENDPIPVITISETTSSVCILNNDAQHDTIDDQLADRAVIEIATVAHSKNVVEELKK